MSADFDQAQALISCLRAELAEAKSREQAIAQKNRTLDQAVQVANEGMVVLDAAFRISYANTAMIRLLDRPLTAIIGQPLPQLVLHPYDDLTSEWQSQCTEGTAWCGGLELVMRDGRHVPVQVTVNALHDEEQLTGYLVMFLDLRNVKDAQSQVTAMRRIIDWSKCSTSGG